MKRITFLLVSLLFTFSTFAAIDIRQLEPSFWWSGMKNSELQIMVYGKDLASTNVQITTPGVILSKVVKGDSPNYLFLYLDLSQAKAGNVNILFTKEKETKNMIYELKKRTIDPLSRKGFTTSDVLYLVMPDRFANGNIANDNLKMKNVTVQVNRKNPNARHGGDLAGIEEHLDYISDLGVTAVWLNPVLENDMPGGSYHGYAITDYYNIDARYGSNGDYVRFIDKTHQKGMKVVMDMIFNHCGSEHIWMKDRPFANWFNFPDGYVQTNHSKFVYFDPYASKYDTKRCVDGWFVDAMPDLNQRNPHLAKYLIQNSIWWVEYAGIDAIRQDTHPYADFDMMSQWCKEVMTEYPNFNIVGEAWMNETPGAAYWQANSKLDKDKNSNLKSVMDFQLMGVAHGAFHDETDWGSGLTKIYETLSYDFLYPDINNLLVFLENHDTDRFLREMPTNLDVFKQAYTFQLTSRGIPQLYYGAEILMNGDKRITDGDVRKDFPGGWDSDSRNAFTAAGRTDLENQAHDFLKKLLTWRKGNEVIAKGSLKHFVPRNGAYVYIREYQGKRVLVILNGKSAVNTISLDQYAEILTNTTQGKDVITGKMVQLNKELTLAPRESLILEL
ncbi:MAG: glycoside hydrolase family 13 protein [Bacteroidales bacterium]|nr:glycoside hydrolase family 13 protein [Bacteroidales bacterium]